VNINIGHWQCPLYPKNINRVKIAIACSRLFSYIVVWQHLFNRFSGRVFGGRRLYPTTAFDVACNDPK